jgi:hypothetical protein
MCVCAEQALQGVFTLDLQASLKVMLHFLGAVIFMWGGMTHVQAIEPIYAAAALGRQECDLLMHTPVAMAAAFRRVSITGMLPVIGFVLPLGFQLVQFVYGDGSSADRKKDELAGQPANEQALPASETKVEDQDGEEEMPGRTSGKDAPAAQSPGMSNGMGAMQWAIVVLFASFYASYAPDLYYAGACSLVSQRPAGYPIFMPTLLHESVGSCWYHRHSVLGYCVTIASASARG